MGQLRPLADRLGALRMGDQRPQPGALDVLGELDQIGGGPRERHLDQDDVGAFEEVAGRILAQQRRRGRQLEAQPQLEARPGLEPLVRGQNLLLPCLSQRQMRPDVRRGEQDRGARGGGQVAELEAVRRRLRAVVARGHDV
jgi:hypothetical protein